MLDYNRFTWWTEPWCGFFSHQEYALTKFILLTRSLHWKVTELNAYSQWAEAALWAQRFSNLWSHRGKQIDLFIIYSPPYPPPWFEYWLGTRQYWGCSCCSNGWLIAISMLAYLFKKKKKHSFIKTRNLMKIYCFGENLHWWNMFLNVMKTNAWVLWRQGLRYVWKII